MEEQDLNENKILTANQMVGELLLSLVLYGAISFVLYRIIYALTYKYFSENQQYVLLAFFVIVLQVLMVFIMFKLGNRKALKKGTIYKNDVPKVMSNISLVIVVLLLLQAFSIFASVDTAINTALEKDFGMKYRETLLSYLYDEDEMAIYQIEKEKAIKEVKKQLYKYLAIVETGICAVYVSAIFLEKKYLYNKAI